MSQLSSHWRLVYVTFRKAIWVTFQTIVESFRAWKYVNKTKNTSRLTEQRTLFRFMEEQLEGQTKEENKNVSM